MSEEHKRAEGLRAQREGGGTDPQATGNRSANPASYRDSEEIFKGLREVVINHNGTEYRLRITSSAKLILTK